MIEVLLVLAIIAVMITVLMPQVMSSMREHQLRGATRVVISAGRHAMSLALLSQREMTVVYDLDNAALTIRVAAPAPAPTDDGSGADTGAAGPAAPADAWAAEPADGPGVPDLSDGAYDGAVAIVDEEVVHHLDGIAISFIELGGEDGYRAESGTHTVLYYTNGRCTPHTIGLADEDGATTTIEVDGLASARVLDK